MECGAWGGRVDEERRVGEQRPCVLPVVRCLCFPVCFSSERPVGESHALWSGSLAVHRRVQGVNSTRPSIQATSAPEGDTQAWDTSPCHLTFSWYTCHLPSERPWPWRPQHSAALKDPGLHTPEPPQVTPHVAPGMRQAFLQGTVWGQDKHRAFMQPVFWGDGGVIYEEMLWRVWGDNDS